MYKDAKICLIKNFIEKLHICTFVLSLLHNTIVCSECFEVDGSYIVRVIENPATS